MQIQASLKEILAGKTTDVYFIRAQEILKSENKNPEVTAEIWTKNLPENYKWGIFAGLEEALFLFKDLNIDIWALPEGSIFYHREPVLTIKGKYLDFASLETPLLGYICQASGISTKAARCKVAAKDRKILSFGARRMHPSLTPLIDRYAFLGGVDGVSAVLSGERLNIKPQGTIPHSVIIILGDTVKGVKAYDKAITEEIPRIILVDTFSDEKVETLRVAKVLGKKLDAVRIDTPSSRRGSLLEIARELREELDLHNYKNVGIFASGGLNEYNIVNLNQWVDGYGIGTCLSNATTINFSLDIVEIEGKPITKKGETSGMKMVFECTRCGMRKITINKDIISKCECGNPMKSLTQKIIENGRATKEPETINDIRKRVLTEINYLDV